VTARHAKERIEVLVQSIDESGKVDWASYCSQAGLQLIPKNARPASGIEFLNSISQFLEELVSALRDSATAMILAERICRPPRSQRTLESIAAASVPSLSRERIRQKESRLLRSLSGGLLDDDYGGLPVLFHPTFSQWWRDAADSLGQRDEIHVLELCRHLASLWDAPLSLVVSVLPTLLAVIRGEANVNSAIGAALDIAPMWYGPIPDSLSALEFRKFRLGGDASRLQEKGIGTLGDLCRALGDGSIYHHPNAIVERLINHCNVVAECSTGMSGLSWDCYRKEFQIVRFPDASVEDPAVFCSTLVQTLAELLSRCKLSRRASEIFLLRTCRDRDTRLTQAEVSRQLGAHQPSITNEEAALLEFLNDVFIGRDFSRLSVWLDERWMSFWDDVIDTYADGSWSFDAFSNALAYRWKVSRAEFAAAAPSIWAVLTLKPNGRARGRKIVDQSAIQKLPSTIIKLRGFRRQH
jgi:hypothetical protein